jgi:hypothetical protein
MRDARGGAQGLVLDPPGSNGNEAQDRKQTADVLIRNTRKDIAAPLESGIFTGGKGRV